MKKSQYIIPILALFISVSAYSQKKKRISNDRVKAYKIAYITDQLNLTEKEAERFWPVYNIHEEEIHKLRKAERGSIKKIISNGASLDDLSESESKEVVSAFTELQNKMYESRKLYINKLKKILPYKKILKLQIAEREFKKKLFENLRDKRKKVLKEIKDKKQRKDKK